MVRQINSPVSAHSNQHQKIQHQKIQRETIEEEDEQETAVQAKSEHGQGALVNLCDARIAQSSKVPTDLTATIDSARSGGKFLAPELQQAMGQAMGADFRGVRVHTDTRSDQLNRSIQAKAFTTGQDVFFRGGAYQPESRSGQELIAHELTHVVQQTGRAGIRSPLLANQSQQPISIQRTLAGKVEHINDEYLNKEKFKKEVSELKLFSNRKKALEHLKSSPKDIATDQDMITELSSYFGRVTDFSSAMKTLSNKNDIETRDAKQNISEPKKQEKKLKSLEELKSASSNTKISLLSTRPAQKITSKKIAKQTFQVSIKPTKKEQPIVDNVMRLYEKGLLLISSVQPKDLPKLHKYEDRTEVEKHVDNKKLEMVNILSKPEGAMRFAKVNWTITSPNMLPHYFKMTKSKDDRTPKDKPDPLGTRIATIVDATNKNLRYMRGNRGDKDFKEWHDDQSSSKLAGVKKGEPVYKYSNEKVKKRINAIIQEQEQGKENNPEINTFGFPPDAVVGFIVANLDKKTEDAIRKAKKKMSKEQQKRSFPVFTWSKSSSKNTKWQLDYLKMM